MYVTEAMVFVVVVVVEAVAVLVVEVVKVAKVPAQQASNEISSVTAAVVRAPTQQNANQSSSRLTNHDNHHRHNRERNALEISISFDLKTQYLLLIRSKISGSTICYLKQKMVYSCSVKTTTYDQAYSITYNNRYVR